MLQTKWCPRPRKPSQWWVARIAGSGLATAERNPADAGASKSSAEGIAEIPVRKCRAAAGPAATAAMPHHGERRSAPRMDLAVTGRRRSLSRGVGRSRRLSRLAPTTR
jgi:hypothetical protein